MIDIGVPKDVLAGNIIGVLGQRLVRRLCTYCRDPYTPNSIERRLLGIEQDVTKVTIFRKKGCTYCEHQGYKGRQALLEALRIDETLDDLISEGSSLRILEDAARDGGFHSLADDGARAVLDGRTSIDEVSRVVDLTQRLKSRS